MIKTDINFQHVLEVLLPGILISVGLWYIYRDFIEFYFPIVSSAIIDQESGSKSILSKLPILLLTSIVLGLLIDHVSDIAVMGIIEDSSESKRANRWDRKFVKLILRFFIWAKVIDPRIRSIERYMSSNERKKNFIQMMNDWAYTSKKSLEENNDEMIMSHQHIVARMRVISDCNRRLIDNAYSHTSNASSMFTAFLLLFFSVIAKIPVYFYFNGNNTLELNILMLLFTLGFFYVLTLLSGYSLRRRFSHFCAQILTLALHAHSEDAKVATV